MKKLITILFLLIILIMGTMVVAKAQGLKATTYAESNHISPKLGTSIGYVFGENIEVGGFFQRATDQSEPETGQLLRQENEFYGAYFAYPLLQHRVLGLHLNVRTGVSNNENFVITPSVMASYEPVKNLTIGCGVGTRAFRPTYMATIGLRLHSTSKKPAYYASK